MDIFKELIDFDNERDGMFNSELSQLRAENARLRDALECIYCCHGSNPSDAMADMPEIDYIKHTLLLARKVAKEALK